jgi:hypothetical protein
MDVWMHSTLEWALDIRGEMTDVFSNSLICACLQPPTWHWLSIQSGRSTYQFIDLWMRSTLGLAPDIREEMTMYSEIP